MTSSRHLFTISKFAILLLAIVFVAFPLYWITITSFKGWEEAYSVPPTLIPDEWTLKSYKAMWLSTAEGFKELRWGLGRTFTFAINGAIVSFSVTFLTMVLAALAGYGFSRFDFPVKKPLLLGLLSTQMFPYVAIMLPIYLVYRSFNLLNTHTGIILGVTGLVLPFSIWMLKTYTDTIEKELEESALLDGANRFQILTKIVLPVIIPALVAVGMFSFLAAWNHLMYVILLLNDLTLATVPIGFKNTYIGQSNVDYPGIAASMVTVSLPVIVTFLVLQKYFVSGLTAGATKG